jgi:hypothetical protein
VRWLVASITIAAAILAAPGASACPPTVRLTGDTELSAELASVLSRRGIATNGDCPALPVIVEKRGKTTVVSQGDADERVDSREVTDVRTAATVIESWVRTDLEAPLLGHRPVTDLESPDRIVAAPPPKRSAHPIQVYALGETSLASDHTTGLGALVGGCLVVGPACLGGRFRFTNVEEGPSEWEAVMDREAVDALLDVDFSKPVGNLRLSAGAGLGLGWIHTHEEQSPPDTKETLGVRVEPHATVSYSVSRHFALESTLSLSVGETIHVSTSTPERLPDDPRLMGRAALGLRFEGP